MRASELLTEHFHAATFMSYSNQALPLNVLLDTLVQPGADTEIGGAKSRLKWSIDERRRIGHVVLGSAKEAGGQWSEDPVSTSWDIEALRLALFSFFLSPVLIRDLGADPGGKAMRRCCHCRGTLFGNIIGGSMGRPCPILIDPRDEK